jgi:hypothetical protein
MKYNCDYSTDDRSNWAKHNKTQSHLKNVDDIEKLKKEKDDTKNKKLPKSYQKITQKLPEKLPESYPTITHASTDSLLSDVDENERESNKSNFICSNCDKRFKFKSGLSRHINHRCPKINTLDESRDDKLIQIIKQQNDLIKELTIFSIL